MTLTSNTIQCRKCGLPKPLEEFTQTKKNLNGRNSRCKACHARVCRELRQRDPFPIRAAERRSRLKHKHTSIYREMCNRSRQRGFDVCIKEDFFAWYKSQPKQCVYCGIDQAEAVQRFAHHLNVDRKNNTLGYMLSNLCLACQRCNLVKTCYLTFEEMKIVGKMINAREALAKAQQ